MNDLFSQEQLHRDGKQNSLKQRTAILNWC
jgi:hypothetical protein